MTQTFPRLAVGCLALCAFALLAGCFDIGSSSGSTKPVAVAPNLVGDWSSLQGEYDLFRIRTEVTAYNSTKGADITFNRCQRPFTYRLDSANQTMSVTGTMILHPSEPGPLRVVYVNDVVFKGACTYSYVEGVNQGSSASPWCLHGTTPPEKASDPWRCHIAIDYSGPAGFLWENVTFRLGQPEPQVNLNGQDFPFKDGGTMTMTETYPGKPWVEYTAKATLEFLGTWPYSGIKRT